jgi:RNA polymerase sigma-70 factor (ECF subfamily)
VGSTGPEPSQADRLSRFIQDEADALLGTLRSYVRYAGLAAGDEVASVALEVLSEVVVEALAHADRFDPARPPRAWLLAFAANVIKRRKADRAKQARRQAPTVRGEADDADGGDIFDRVAALRTGDPIRDLESDQQAAAILARVSADDQRILRLAVLRDLDGEAVAHELGVSPGAARVRLHRAIRRLHDAWQAWEQQEQ